MSLRIIQGLKEAHREQIVNDILKIKMGFNILQDFKSLDKECQLKFKGSPRISVFEKKKKENAAGLV